MNLLISFVSLWHTVANCFFDVAKLDVFIQTGVNSV